MAQQPIRIGDTLQRVIRIFNPNPSNSTPGKSVKGETDCSANPNYPAAVKGDTYYVSVSGKIGGASGKVVTAGDAYIASADNAGGTEASVGSSWFVLDAVDLTGITITWNLKAGEVLHTFGSASGVTVTPLIGKITLEIEKEATILFAEDRNARSYVGFAYVGGNVESKYQQSEQVLPQPSLKR